MVLVTLTKTHIMFNKEKTINSWRVTVDETKENYTMHYKAEDFVPRKS